VEKGNKWEGIRNGMLVAVKNTGVRHSETGRPYSTWLFRCDCGNEKILCPNDVFKVRPNNLKIKGVLSCGCRTKEIQSEVKRKPDGVAALNSLYAQYKLNCAQYRGHEFCLTLEEFKVITSSNCYYCNDEPGQFKKSKTSFYKYNGVDRVDNTKGYTLQNTVASCGSCNSLKSGVTIDIAKKMLKFLGIYNE